MEENKDCPICMEPLDNGSVNGVYTIQQCSHSYHTECIMYWYQQSTNCPLCRVNTSIYGVSDDYRVYKGRVRFLRNYARRKNAPKELKKMNENIQKREKKYKENKEILKEFREEKKEILKEYKNLRNNVWKSGQSVSEAKRHLSGFPILQIPERVIQVIKNDS